MHCPLVRALAKLSKAEVLDDGNAAAMEDGFAEQVQEHRATRAHISDELQAHLGPKPVIKEGDSYSSAMAVFKQREGQVKLERDAYKVLHTRKQQEEKEQKAKAKAEAKQQKAKKRARH